MTITRLASRCARGATGSVALTLLTLLIAGCSAEEPDPSPSAPAASSATPGEPSPTPVPTPSPTPSPPPTPRFTNEPDPDLSALIPESVGGATLVQPALDVFGLTPGDVGTAYGEIGDRFASLVIAYVEQPRTTLYAVRVDGDPVQTEDLEPYLETAGRYVGIAGLVRDPWQLAAAGGHQVWVRPEDNATAAGTMVYTWSSGEFVFLLIGVDDAVNEAIVAALPGEPAPSPTAVPSVSPSAPEGTQQPSPSPGE
ncbi:MAG: hypothetical protein ACRDGV_02460 [Candidatus Limnocylindria bacterium]